MKFQMIVFGIFQEDLLVFGISQEDLLYINNIKLITAFSFVTLRYLGSQQRPRISPKLTSSQPLVQVPSLPQHSTAYT